MEGNRWPGLGPVFRYERVVASRRWQGYAQRSLFVGLLLASLVLIWLGRSGPSGGSRLAELAWFGEKFYTAMIGTQLTLVLLAAPAATAGAICLDRARGTLTHVLVTDLTDGEVVLGKLAARLVPVLGLVGCTLPVMALLTLLGGVDPDAMLGAFVVTLGVAVLGCCLAMAFSIRVGKTHEALIGTYAAWCLWLLAGPMTRRLGAVPGLASLVPELPPSSDPFHLAFAPYWYPGSVGRSDYLGFLAATLATSAGLAAWSVLRMRALCTRDVAPTGRKRRPPRPTPTHAWRLPGPSLDGNPVLWREWHRARPSRLTKAVVVLYFGLSAAFVALAVVSGGRHFLATVNGLQVAIGLLLLSVTAATSLAEERVRGGLDVLLATPLSTRQVVLGKWLGTFRLVPPLAVLPVSIFLFGGGHGLENLGGALLMLAYVLASGAAVTGLGLAMATWCSRPGRAVGLAVASYVLVAVGWFFVALMAGPRGPRAEGLAMGSPFAWGAVYCFEFTSGNGARPNGDLAITWTVACGLAAVGLLLATLASFNRCLGRVEGASVARTPPREPIVLARVGQATQIAP